MNSIEVMEKIRRIAELKKLLAGTDYKAIKYAEGEITPSEYSEIRILRRQWRNEINELGG